MNGKRFASRAGALLVALALVAAACGGDDSDDASSAGTRGEGSGTAAGGVECEGLALGFFGALTGANANLGINIQKGAQLAIDEFNEENPDCQVELKSFDSQGDPAQAPGLATEAINDDSIVGIIGPAFSGESAAANPLFDEAGLPIVTASATNPGLSQEGWAIFHRMLGNDNDQGPAAASYMTETLGAEKVFVVDDATEYGRGLAEAVKDALGDALGGEDTVQEGQTDFSATVTKITAAAPDAVFYSGYYAEAGPFAKQLKDAGVTATFVSGDGSKDPGFVEGAGAAAEGAILTCPCAPPDNFPEFYEAYEAKFGEQPQTYGAEAYDAATAFLLAIADGNTDRESILEFLGTLSAPGVTKTIEWDDSGEPTDKAVYAYKVEGGEIVAAQAEPIS